MSDELARFFRDEEVEWGHKGDYENWTSDRAAIELIRHLRAQLSAQVDALRVADAHLGWGDATLENVHGIVRNTIAAGEAPRGDRSRALRDAAALYCEHCANDVPLVAPDDKVTQWSHSGPGVWAWCKVQKLAALRAGSGGPPPETMARLHENVDRRIAGFYCEVLGDPMRAVLVHEIIEAVAAALPSGPPPEPSGRMMAAAKRLVLEFFRDGDGPRFESALRDALREELASHGSTALHRCTASASQRAGRHPER